MPMLAVQAVRVVQPLGEFFAFALNAETLNRVTYSLPAEAQAQLEREEGTGVGGGYLIFGAQRQEDIRRLSEIANFIQTADAAFPNAIILAANYDAEGQLIEDPDKRWRVREANGVWYVDIPDIEHPTASIIDGQHRLHAFRLLPGDSQRRHMEMLCVVFLDLPTPYHAYVFATINFNQKKVDRSLAYELFGFDVEERPPQFWAPETLAVYIARLLNTDTKSPLYRCIAPAADAHSLFDADLPPAVESLRISMATVVDGILRLISKKPKDDRYLIRRPDKAELGRRALADIAELPLRALYINGNDKAIYEVISNFFRAVEQTIWSGVPESSYLKKTIGVQALFDVLRELVKKGPVSGETFAIEKLQTKLSAAINLDPDGSKYESGGVGRIAIRNDVLNALDM
jgi:DNA phosphorothioation-associated DGQHR protein 1